VAGSHRAERPKKPARSAIPRWALVAAIVVALVPAAYLTAHRTFQDTAATPGDHTTDLPIPPVSPSTRVTITTPSVTPSVTPSPTATSKPVPTLPRVAPDAPRRITSGNAIDSGFDSSVTDLDASSDAEVARWDSRGSPGSPGTDTVYVLGRVRTDAAFARLGDLRKGSTVSIRTDSGTLTYTVLATALRQEDGLSRDPLFRRHHAGRLVLVGIRYDASGDRLGKVLVVTAQLSGAKRS
jgi:hypothetical protein